jgi:hypothetical protein
VTAPRARENHAGYTRTACASGTSATKRRRAPPAEERVDEGAAVGLVARVIPALPKAPRVELARAVHAAAPLGVEHRAREADADRDLVPLGAGLEEVEELELVGVPGGDRVHLGGDRPERGGPVVFGEREDRRERLGRGDEHRLVATGRTPARARERERPARGREGGVERHVRGVHAVEQLGGLGVEPERGGQRAHLRRAGE